jgi:type I restriction enzyme R subunit
MTKITESEIERFAIELLEKQGYQYIYAPSIAPDSDTPERESFENVLLMDSGGYPGRRYQADSKA